MAQNAEKLRKAEAERKDAELAELRKESQDAKDSLEKEKVEHNDTKAKKDELEERIRTIQDMQRERQSLNERSQIEELISESDPLTDHFAAVQKQKEMKSLKEAFESDLERVKRDHDQQIETYKLKIAQLNNKQKCQLEELTSKVRP